MLRVIIIDDEKDAVTSLTRLIVDTGLDIELVGTAHNGLDGLDLIRELKPDLIFLDIHMPGISGLEMLRRADDIEFKVIFTTGYERYAIRAFEFSAIDYLLKPILPEDLVAAFRKAEKLHRPRISRGQQDLLDGLIMEPENKPDRIALSTGDGFIIVDLAEIIRVQADNTYSRIFFKQQKPITTAKPISYYETLLDDYGFMRIHRSHLLHLGHVIAYRKADGGYLETTDNEKIPLPKSRKNAILKAIDQFSPVFGSTR